MILAILKSYSAGGEEIPGITFNFNVYFLLTLYFHFHFSLLPKKKVCVWGRVGTPYLLYVNLRKRFPDATYLHSEQIMAHTVSISCDIHISYIHVCIECIMLCYNTFHSVCCITINILQDVISKYAVDYEIIKG